MDGSRGKRSGRWTYGIEVDGKGEAGSGKGEGAQLYKC